MTCCSKQSNRCRLFQGKQPNCYHELHDIMQEMGEQDRQVISITHLPQIAARGCAHYKVYKQDNETETNSHIRRLADEERVEEIAHMLSGATLTEAALNNAKALLGIKR